MQRRILAACLAGAALLAAPVVHAQDYDKTAQWLASLKARLDHKEPAPGAIASAINLDFSPSAGASISAADFRQLADMPKLQNLSLYPFATDDIVAEVAKAAPKLTELGLHGSRALTDAGLAPLSQLTSLRRVTVFGTQIGKEGAAHLARIPSLDELDLSGTPGGDASLIALKGAANLRTLTYTRIPAISEAGWSAIAAYPKLRRLTIYSEGPIGPEIGKLADSKTLDSISLMMAKIEDAGGVRLGDIKTLDSVFVWRTQVGDGTMKALGSLPRMRTLYLDNTRATDDGIRGLAAAKALETLWLSETAVTGAGFDAFRDHQKLSWIRAGKTAIDDAGLTAIAAIKPLRTLSLDNSKVTDAGLAALAGHPNLSSIDLSETAVTDAGLVHLAKAEKLTRVTLRKTKVTDDGVASLKAALPKVQVTK